MNEQKGVTAPIAPDRADVKQLVEEDAGKPLQEQAGIPEAEAGVEVPLTNQQTLKRARSAAQQASTANARESKRQKKLLKDQAPSLVVPQDNSLQEKIDRFSNKFEDFVRDHSEWKNHHVSKIEEIAGELKEHRSQWSAFSQEYHKPKPSAETEVPIQSLGPQEPLIQNIDEYPSAFTPRAVRFG